MPVTFIAASLTELTNALAQAVAGDVIAIRGKLGAFTFKDLQYDGPVTIRPENPGDGFSQVTVDACKNMTFEGLSVKGNPQSPVVTTPGHTFYICNGSSYIKVLGCDVQWGVNGIVTFGGHHIEIRGNNVDNVGSDGLKFSGVTDFEVIDNILPRHLWPTETAHADMMQFQGPACLRARIRGNVMLPQNRSDVQGIFMGGNGGHSSITIEENILSSQMTNGIYVAGTGGTGGIVVRNNTVVNDVGDTDALTTRVSVYGDFPDTIIEGNIWGADTYAKGANLILRHADLATVFQGPMASLTTLDMLKPVPGSDGELYGARVRLAELLAPVPEPVPEPEPEPEPGPTQEERIAALEARVTALEAFDPQRVTDVEARVAALELATTAMQADMAAQDARIQRIFDHFEALS